MQVAKRNEISEITVGDRMFHARKFRALPSSRIAGNITALASPLLGGAGPLIDAWSKQDEGASILDLNFGEVLPGLTVGLAKLNGAELEAVLKELLIDEGCISFGGDLLTQNKLDELFCGDLGGLLMLALEVIKLNFGSLFTLLGIQFGSRAEPEQPKVLT